MNDKPFNSLFGSLQMWFSRRSHRERIYILLIGWVVIYFFWYAGLQRPLKTERAHIAQQSQESKILIGIFKAQSEKITREAKDRATKQQASMQSRGNAKLEWASTSNSDEIIKEILNTERNVQFVSLKTNSGASSTTANKQTSGNVLEIVFNSNYFDTITYLEQLEKLPWCLSWDNMEYKVTSYPKATVTISLSMLGN